MSWRPSWTHTSRWWVPASAACRCQRCRPPSWAVQWLQTASGVDSAHSLPAWSREWCRWVGRERVARPPSARQRPPGPQVKSWDYFVASMSPRTENMCARWLLCLWRFRCLHGEGRHAPPPHAATAGGPVGRGGWHALKRASDALLPGSLFAWKGLCTPEGHACHLGCRYMGPFGLKDSMRDVELRVQLYGEPRSNFAGIPAG